MVPSDTLLMPNIQALLCEPVEIQVMIGTSNNRLNLFGLIRFSLAVKMVGDTVSRIVRLRMTRHWIVLSAKLQYRVLLVV
jgi:hypothetical protein